MYSFLGNNRRAYEARMAVLMIPVKQTIFDSISGNCFGACLASLLEIPLEDVPNFGAPGEKEYNTKNLNEFLQQHGYFHVSVGVKCLENVPDVALTKNYPGYYIVIGHSHRGDWNHAVIYRGSELVFDPMPDTGYKHGLKGPVCGGTNHYEATFLVPLEIKT